MRELDNSLMCKIFEEINSDKHKILKVKKIIESIEGKKLCIVHLFDDIFLETKKEDYCELIQKYFPILLEYEEYEICHKLKQLELL
jgi:calcineurin-like phosphoesterase family protein